MTRRAKRAGVLHAAFDGGWIGVSPSTPPPPRPEYAAADQLAVSMLSAAALAMARGVTAGMARVALANSDAAGVSVGWKRIVIVTRGPAVTLPAVRPVYAAEP